MCGGASIVESRENPRWTFLLDQVAYDLVVEILDWCPFDLLAVVLFLLSLQCELDKDLLQLLVDVVDAELFEGVVLRVGEFEFVEHRKTT